MLYGIGECGRSLRVDVSKDGEGVLGLGCGAGELSEGGVGGG